MKKRLKRNRFYLILFIVSFVLSISLISQLCAEITGPGWIRGEADPVSPADAQAYYSSKQGKIATQGIVGFAVSASAPATSVSPEIKELARGLQYNPKLIYDYIRNHIDYVPYFGSLKGATLTYLDSSGNDFDQASLMIALLRESSNYNASIGNAQYVYGTMTIPGAQLANWLGVDQRMDTIWKVLAYGGIPIKSFQLDGTMDVSRVWVKVTIDGSDYLFDPAFKTYKYTSKIDIGQALGYNRSDFLTSAQAGATVGIDYVQNLNEGNIRNKLVEYSSNLINTIRSQYPNSSVGEIIGGRNVIQTNPEEYPASLPFATTVIETWNEIPDVYTTTFQIQHMGINYTFATPEIAGKRLTITYAGDNYYPQLRLDGNLIASGNPTTPGSRNDITLTIDHPYADDNGTYLDQTANTGLANSGTYAILTSFGGTSNALLAKRQKILDSFLAEGLPTTSEKVLGETLNIIGLTWMKEYWLSMRLSSAIADTVLIPQHIGGFMMQESRYTISIEMLALNVISKHGIVADEYAVFAGHSPLGSALEHGILEQLMGSDKPGLSTVKVLQVANSRGNKIFYADSNNFATIKPQFYNYSQTSLNNLETDVNNGYVFILPENGKITLGQWQGFGIIFMPEVWSHAGWLIGQGDYQAPHGGSTYYEGNVDPEGICIDTGIALDNSCDFSTIARHVSSFNIPTSNEPVDMAGGAYLYEHTDLIIGNNAPKGLAFTRFYNSSMNLEERTLGYSWTHNYDIYLNRFSHGDPGLGTHQPVDSAALITELYISQDIMKNEDILLGYVITSLASKWAMDQLIDNAITVHLGSKLMEYIKLPDGTYSPPPGITTQLIDNLNGTFSLKERFGTRMDFNADNRIVQLTDIDGNTMTFTYNAYGLETVRDAFNRTLTLNYSGGRVSSVSDSTGRSVSYTYDSSGNFITYKDPELKEWGYGYDTNHRMTSLTNPLNITTATNTYDTLGRVKTQTVPRQGGNNVTYNFYFSGFRNAEEDPDGKTIVYYFDEKGRPIGEENQLGYKNTKEYDGQFHVVKTTDPRSNTTSFLYDGNQNLIRTTNVLTQSNDFIYDAQFHLTDTVDPLFHGSHIEYDTEHHPYLSKYGIRYDSSFQPLDDGISQASASYYANGFPQTTTDGRSTQTTLIYDSYGNPQTTKTANHPVLTTNYNSKGWLMSLTDQVNTTTSFDQYNNRGQLKLKTDPLLKQTSFTYYDNGNPWTITDRNNNTTTYSYTPTDKINTITYQDTSTVHLTYNQHDDLTGMQDLLGSTTYTYDVAHRLISQTDANGFTIGYGYDEVGNVTSITYPGNKKVIYTYDELNRLKTVTIDWLSQTATYTYDDAGRLDYLVNFNGTVTDYGYDNANRLIALENKKSDSNVIATYQFTLDSNGNRTQVVQNEPLILTLNTDTINYTYNTKRNRLLTAGASNFAYDNEGQLSDSNGTSYTFDYEHRLVGINISIQFYYDGAGNRLKAVRNGVETRYIYDTRGNLLAEADSNNVITKYYIHGIGLIAMVTPPNDVYVYHFNAVGSTIVMTDSSQNMVNKYAYDPFGNILNQQETVQQPFKFVGQFGVMTEPNGFYYMRARYYDPSVGRFISEDPIGFDGGDVNLYAYVANNPITLIDPSGQLAFFWHAGITYVAARNSGRGVWESAKMAWNVMAEDRSAFSHDPNLTMIHAMGGQLPGGGYQTPAAAISSTMSYINTGISPGTIHAAQDLPIHAGQSMKEYSFFSMHTLRDITGGGTIGHAYQNTLNILNRGCGK